MPGRAGVGIQVPQLDNDCVTVLGMFGAEAEQVAGTVLLCLAGQGWVYKCRSWKSPMTMSQCWACLVPRLSRSQRPCYCAWLCWVPFWQLWENHLLLIRLDGLVQGDICSQSKQPQSIMTGWGGSTKLITFRDHIYPCIHSL